MPKLVRLLLRVLSAGVLAAVMVYALQSAAAGHELPGFRLVIFVALVGALGVWQLSATPKEIERETESLRDVVWRDNMIKWFVFAALAVGYAVYQMTQGSGDDVLLGLIAGVFCLSVGLAEKLWFERRRRIRSSEQ